MSKLRVVVGKGLALLGAVVAVFSLVALVFGLDDYGWDTLVAGIVMFLLGGAILPPGGVPEDAPPVCEPSEPERAADPEAPAEAIFSVIENIEEHYLPRIARLLEDDPRVRTVVEEEGRHYAVPDRDDLPKWFALRVCVAREDCDAVMEELPGRIEEALGADARHAVTINRF